MKRKDYPLKYRIRLFLFDVIKYTFPLLLLGVLYLIFSFIAFDWNPANWWLFTTTMGRFTSIILFGIYLRGLYSAYFEDI